MQQVPQRLKTLREHALIESAVSSNRIEGVEVDRARVGTVVFGKPPFRDRDEEEVHGYREALSLIHGKADRVPVSEKTILMLHRLARGDMGDAGQYRRKDSDIIETYPDGRVRVRFKPVSAKKVAGQMRQLVDLWPHCSGCGVVSRPCHALQTEGFLFLSRGVRHASVLAIHAAFYCVPHSASENGVLIKSLSRRRGDRDLPL
jgi:hypothetical protein